MKAKYLIIIWHCFLLFQLFYLSSCKKFVSVDMPNDQFNSNTVFLDSSTAVSAITGIYSEMLTNRNLFSNSATTLYGGLSADELYYFTPGTKDEFARNEITQVNHINIDNSFWKPAYSYIYSANLAIEKLIISNSISPALKSQLIGEAKFIRAFCYFYLVNLFGDVPLILTSDYKVNSIAARTPVFNIYSQIIEDLLNAKHLLKTQYITPEKVRPNKWTAAALLSRCYLYVERWEEASTEAKEVINSGEYFLETNLNNVFLKNSSEAIWQLKPVRPGFNTYEGLEILPASNFSMPTYLISQNLLNDFELGDKRKSNWITSRIFNNNTFYLPFKYKIPNSATSTEYYTVFRLSEQYLILAEAEINKNNILTSALNINIIRNRAGLLSTSANDIASLKLAIEHERRVELFCEWSHRWFDLRRTRRADALLSPIKNPNWQSTDVLWPIPQQEINVNPNLIQNPGY